MTNTEIRQAVSERISGMSAIELRQFVEVLIERLFEDSQAVGKQANQNRLDVYIREHTDQMIEKHRSLLNRLA